MVRVTQIQSLMVFGERLVGEAEDGPAEKSRERNCSERSCLGKAGWPLEPRRSLEALPQQVRSAGRFAISFAGKLPVGLGGRTFRTHPRLEPIAHSSRTHTVQRCGLASSAVPTAGRYA